MRLFVTTTFFIALIVLCNRNIAQGVLIKKDVSQHPIHISASNITTWQKDGIRVFQAQGNVEIEQGDIRITADSVIIWFKEVKIGQLVEGNLEIYCEGNVTLFQEDDIQDYKEIYLELVTTAGVAVSPTHAHVQVKSFEDEQRSGLYVQAEKFKAKEKGEPYKDDTPTGTAAAGAMVDIIADDIDTWLENDVRIIVAIGNVRIKKGDETLTADNVILYFDQEEGEKDKPQKQIYKEVYAEGNVTLKRKDDVIIAKKIFENIKENKGIFVNSTITSTLKPPVVRQATPVYVTGEEIKHEDKGRYEVKNGHFSLCSYGHPHYRFKFSKLRITKSAKSSIASTRNNVFYVGKVPIMYVPFLNFDLRSKTKRLEEWDTGTTTRFGRFVNTDWDVYGFAFGEKMDPWSDLTLSLNYMQLKGPGAGVDFEYGKENFNGYLETYFIVDDDETGINGVEVEKTTRGHFLWRHRLMLSKVFDDKSGTDDNESDINNNDGWIADIEISQVSDRSFFREYFQPQLKSEKDRETAFYLRKLSDNRGITFFAEHQLRTYDTLIDSERLSRKNESFPELKYRIIGEPLWDGKLNFTSETELVYQNRLFDRISPLKAETNFLGRGELLTAERVFDRTPTRFAPEETIRFDTNNMLNAPFRFFGQKFNPFIGTRFTGYSESVKVDPVTGRNEGSGTPRGRIAIPIGINTSTTLSQTYSIYNKFLNINRLRHIMVPELSLNFIPVVTQDPEDLNQFDGTDALDTYSSIRFGLSNRLQTKRGEPGKEKTVDIVYFDTRFNFFPGNAGLNRKRDNYIELDLNLKLHEKISFFSEGNEFNLDESRIDILNTSLGYNHPKWGNFAIGNRFSKNIISTVTFSASKPVGEKWFVNFTEQYAFSTTGSDSGSLFASANIQRLFHDWIVNIGISQIGTREDDNIVTFNVLPKGIKARPQTFTLQQLGVLVPGSAAREEHLAQKKAQARK